MTQDKAHRYEALDSLRSLAAFVVVLIHAQSMFGFYVVKLPWPLSGLLDSRAAVAFFFVLSGFVLHLSFAKASLSFSSFAGFQVRRIFRIYPLYYLSLLAVIAVIYSQERNAFPHFWGDDGAKDVLKANHADVRQWLQQILLVGPGFDMFFLNPPSWTLAVEMRVAVIFPFLSWITSRLSIGKGAIFTLASLPFAFLGAKLTRLGFIELVPLFLMGAFFAEHRRIILETKILLWQMLVLSLLSLALYSSRISLREISPGIGWHVCGLGSLGFMFIALRSGRVSGLLLRPSLVFLGRLSYGIYILHFAILLGLSTQKPKFESSGAALILFVVGLVLTIAISFVTYRLVEKPFVNLGRKLSEKFVRKSKFPADDFRVRNPETMVR